MHTHTPKFDGKLAAHSAEKNWVTDLHSPRSHCLPSLQGRMLQLSTPWQWDIVRSCHSGRAEGMVQTMILTDVMILATIHCPPPATHHLPHAPCRPPNTARLTPSASLFLVPGVCNSASLWIEHAGTYSGGAELFKGSFGRWKTLSLWKFWLIEGSRSVVAVASRRL